MEKEVKQPDKESLSQPPDSSHFVASKHSKPSSSSSEAWHWHQGPFLFCCATFSVWNVFLHGAKVFGRLWASGTHDHTDSDS